MFLVIYKILNLATILKVQCHLQTLQSKTELTQKDFVVLYPASYGHVKGVCPKNTEAKDALVSLDGTEN